MLYLMRVRVNRRLFTALILARLTALSKMTLRMVMISKASLKVTSHLELLVTSFFTRASTMMNLWKMKLSKSSIKISAESIKYSLKIMISSAATELKMRRVMRLSKEVWSTTCKEIGSEQVLYSIELETCMVITPLKI